jgi:exonuclease VII large subunit
MTSSVIDARDDSIRRAEALLNRLEKASNQLKIPEPLSEQIQKKIKQPDTQPSTPSDILLDAISYVIQAENAGTLSETRQKTQEIKDRALKIKKEAAQLQAQIDALKGYAQEILLAYQERCATEEQIQQSSENIASVNKASLLEGGFKN